MGHRSGWEEATEKEEENGEVWEVMGTVVGFGQGSQGMKRAKGVEDRIKKEKGKGFQREKFVGDGEAHKKRIIEVVESMNGGMKGKQDVWKHWSEQIVAKEFCHR